MITTADKKTIKPDEIIGTKWISTNKFFGGKMAVEFVDRKNCIYISQPKQYSMTYCVLDGKLYINCINGPFDLRGDMLFNNDLPVFKKAA